MENLIIQKVGLFASWAVVTAIILVVGLLILRLIADLSNLNFFGWTYVTIRRLTDPLIVPVRGALRGFGVDPKYAPLVTILIAVLLGWIALQVTGSILSTISGVIAAVHERSVAHLIGHILYGFLALYTLLIFMRVVFSWVMLTYSNRLMRFLFRTTEPLLGPLRRRVPTVGMFDISPFIAFLIIWLFQMAVRGTLLSS
jgi:YggT family protein